MCSTQTCGVPWDVELIAFWGPFGMNAETNKQKTSTCPPIYQMDCVRGLTWSHVRLGAWIPVRQGCFAMPRRLFGSSQTSQTKSTCFGLLCSFLCQVAGPWVFRPGGLQGFFFWSAGVWWLLVLWALTFLNRGAGMLRRPPNRLVLRLLQSSQQGVTLPDGRVGLLGKTSQKGRRRVLAFRLVQTPEALGGQGFRA